MKNFVRVVLVALAMSVYSTPAAADAIVFFDVCASADCFATGHAARFVFEARRDGTGLPGGAVDVNVTGFLFGDQAFGFNVAGDLPVTFSNISSGFTLGFNESIDPFGQFEFVFDAPAAGGSLFFTLMREGGFHTFDDILEMNDEGFFAAAHIRTFPFPGFPIRTSLVGADGPVLDISTVPEPGTMVLLATGLAAAWRARRRRFGHPAE